MSIVIVTVHSMYYYDFPGELLKLLVTGVARHWSC
jgi:hypothetical protein